MPGDILPAEFDGVMRRAAGAIIADARLALFESGRTDAEVVHEFRKALKRWRALLRLLRRPLGKQADRRRAEARALMRVLAGARDPQSALDALHDLGKAENPPPPAILTAAAERLTALRDTAERHIMTDAMRGRLGRYLDETAPSLDRRPLEGVAADTVADALTASYRRARRRIPDRWTEADADHLHALRRRLVEHRHQIDLIGHVWPPLGQLGHDEARRLRNRLGAYQNLVVLERLAAARQPLARWRSQLTPAMTARRHFHLKAAARLADRLFAEKPKAFRQRIAALSADDAPKHAKPLKRSSKPK
jgi:CHAD domain-containing protein